MKNYLDIIKIKLGYYLKNYFPVQATDFSSVANWLGTFTYGKDWFSLIIENGEVWVQLKNGVLIRYLNKLNSVSSLMVSYGPFEDMELNTIMSNLNEDSVFFDIGANVGLYSLSVAKRFKNVEIHAFEPVPDTLAEFYKNIIKNNLSKSNIIMNSFAVNDIEGTTYITTDYHSSNYLTTSKSRENKIQIRSCTIDGYVSKKLTKNVDLIKIDVEGKEFNVLKGARKTLERFHPIVLVEVTVKFNEFHDKDYVDYKAIIEYMTNLGYKYGIINNDGFVKSENFKIDIGEKTQFYYNFLFYYEDLIYPEAIQGNNHL